MGNICVQTEETMTNFCGYFFFRFKKKSEYDQRICFKVTSWQLVARSDYRMERQDGETNRQMVEGMICLIDGQAGGGTEKRVSNNVEQKRSNKEHLEYS